MQPSIPKMMRAVILNAASQALEVKEVPVPQPASGQVLIKMEASPINPSDLGVLTGIFFFPCNI